VVAAGEESKDDEAGDDLKKKAGKSEAAPAPRAGEARALDPAKPTTPGIRQVPPARAVGAPPSGSTAGASAPEPAAPPPPPPPPRDARPSAGPAASHAASPARA